MPETALQIKPITIEYRPAVREFLQQYWGSPQMVYSQGLHQCDELPGFIAIENNKLIGLITYSVQGNEYEIVSLDSIHEGRGIGGQLMNAVENVAIANKATRIRLITTNDNLNALKFYQKRGYTLTNLYPNAVAQARKIKPQIPLIGYHNLPIRDELELEKAIVKEDNQP